MAVTLTLPKEGIVMGYRLIWVYPVTVPSLGRVRVGLAL
jgi:hypothetical protein